MTKLYLLDLRRYESGLWRELLPQISASRRSRALACRFEPDKMRIVCAGWLLQKALEQAGVAPQEQIFLENEYGKPYLPNHPDVHFSLSHSGVWAACAIADHPIGVDIELPRCRLDVARRFFHPDELKDAEALDRIERSDLLNRLWTGKEAFLKMLGCGMTVPLNSFMIHLGDTAELEQSYTDKPYKLFEYKQGFYRLCLCAQGIRPEPEIIE